MIHEDTREQFENRAFNKRFLCGITKVGDGPFPFKVDCPPFDVFTMKKENGTYLDETLNIMWWAWNQAIEETTKLKAYFANFEGYPLGATAVVVAESKDHALDIINQHRVVNGIGDRTAPTLDEVEEVQLHHSHCPYFDDGDY